MKHLTVLSLGDLVDLIEDLNFTEEGDE